VRRASLGLSSGGVSNELALRFAREGLDATTVRAIRLVHANADS
jgi:hypothetical protein